MSMKFAELQRIHPDAESINQVKVFTLTRSGFTWTMYAAYKICLMDMKLYEDGNQKPRYIVNKEPSLATMTFPVYGKLGGSGALSSPPIS